MIVGKRRRARRGAGLRHRLNCRRISLGEQAEVDGELRFRYRDAKHVDILLFTEHRDRELEVVTEMARQIRSEHGRKVAIASSIFRPLLASLLVRPKVVVSTSLAQGPASSRPSFRRFTAIARCTST